MKSHKLTIISTLFFAILACALLVKCSYELGNAPSTPPAITASPEQVAAKLKKETEFKRVVLGAMLLKERMKNPDSFKLNSATLMENGALCYEYRATNSFNAVVPGTLVVTANKVSQDSRDWNQYCAGKSGTDYSYARQAL